MIGGAADPPPPLILAVNKMDLFESAVLTTDEICEKFDANFVGIFFVSALTGNNVDQLFCCAGIEALRFTHRLGNLGRSESSVEERTGRGVCC
jgi:predicted GTPase